METDDWACWHGACPSLFQRWVREQINYLKASCCSLSTSAPLMSRRLHWCTPPIPSVLSFRLHFATRTTVQWRYWGHIVSDFSCLLQVSYWLSEVKCTWFILYSWELKWSQRFMHSSSQNIRAVSGLISCSHSRKLSAGLKPSVSLHLGIKQGSTLTLCSPLKSADWLASVFIESCWTSKAQRSVVVLENQ